MRRGLTGFAFVATMLSVGLATNIGGGSTMAVFSATTGNASTLNANRIFPGNRVVSAWDLRDASGGTELNTTQDVSLADAVFRTTGLWTTTFQSTRYFDFEMNSPLPAGLPVTAAAFELDFADSDNNAGNNACYYFEARRTSTAQVLATYGSSGSPIACEAAAVMTATSTSMPAVTTSDIANDLTIRVYMKHSASKAIRVDRANVSITTYGYTRRLYPVVATDAATGTPVATIWGPARSEGTGYQTANNWATAFAAGRYLKFAFPSMVPGSAQLTSISLSHSYKSATAGDTTSVYYEIYNGTTLLGNRGSSAAPFSSNATTAFSTDTFSIATEVNSATRANNLVIRIYGRNTGTRKSLHDLLAVTVNYTLGANGCVEPGTYTLISSADTWIQQDGANANSNFGTDTLLDVKTQSVKNRRALVDFPALPALAAGCNLTAATLRINATTVQGTRTFDAYRISTAWTETVVTWNNQPGTTGTAASTSAAVGWMTWNVLSQVQTWYSSGNDFGFMIRDSVEDAGSASTSTLQSRENTNDPELVITIA
jgi:hypothetical protein